MSERVFCIDFGSAYTKVALRRDPGATSELINSPTRRAEEVEFCVPSLALIDRTGKEPQVEFGPGVVGRQAGNGIELHPNWKRHLFVGVTQAGETPVPPLDAFFQSEELRQLAEKFGVTQAQIGHMRQMVASARGVFGVADAQPTTNEAQYRKFGSNLAVRFFRWLRTYILAACSSLRGSGLNPETIPVRITVPAFAHGRGIETHPGCVALTDALRHAGWPVHPDRPILSEPYSNIIGVLTRGVNVVYGGKLKLAKMFREGPIPLVLSGKPEHPCCRAWSIDVGAFTTDFTALNVDTGGALTDDPEDAISVVQHSLPLGVSELDRRVLDILPAEQQAWMRRAGHLDWEDFRTSVYTLGRAYTTYEVGAIGGPNSRELINQVIAQFGQELGAACSAFRQQLTPSTLQELILTGGGNFVPAVNQSLTTAMQSGGQEFVHIYQPVAGKRVGSDRARRLGIDLTRGASALGGASIYFEKSYY